MGPDTAAAQPRVVPEERGVIALYVSDRTRLIRLATLLLGNHQEAEDVVQEAFVRLERRAGRMADVAEQHAYVRQIVLNLSRSSLRRRMVALKHAPRPAAASPGADVPLLAALERDQLFVALGRLSIRQRQALVLRFYEDLSEAEIARAMQCKPGTVKATLSQAKRSLAKHLDEQEYPRGR